MKIISNKTNKKILTMLFGFMFSALALAGLGSKPANAEVAVDWNAEASKITINHTVMRLTGPLSRDFDLKIEAYGENKSGISNLQDTTISYLDEEPDSNGIARKSIELDLSDVELNSSYNEYQVKVSCDTGIPFTCDGNGYIVNIYVFNEVNEYNEPTGRKEAQVGEIYEIKSNGLLATSKSETLDFICKAPQQYVPKLTYIKITNTVEGEESSENDVFRYEFKFDENIWENAIYTIITPDDEYEFGGQKVTSDTEIKVGETAVFYLKHGQSAYIGLPSLDQKDNKNAYEIELPRGSEITYSYYEYPDVKDYKTWIDNKESGNRVEIKKTLHEDPADNETLYINTRKTDKTVNTGLRYANGALIILVVASVFAILVVVMSHSGKKAEKDEIVIPVEKPEQKK